MNFKYINPGSFVMGSPEEENGRSKHENQHCVTLTKGFYLQTTPVSVSQWRKFSIETGYKTEAEKDGGAWGHVKAKLHVSKKWVIPVIIPKHSWQKREHYYWDNPGFYQTDDHPVTCISWNDTQAFVDWINQKEDLNYRLPTEAEWEYACRAGSITPFSFGSAIKKKAICNIIEYEAIKCFLSNKRTVVEEQYSPNAWGLYNMHGNVWEWCQDSCDWNDNEKSIVCETYEDEIVDPINENGEYRILRGGSWFYQPSHCRSAHRRVLQPDFKASGIGFRLSHM